MKLFGTLIIVFAIFFVLAYAQDDDWKIMGHLQPRSELDGRDFSNATHPLTFASMRTRLGVGKSIGRLAFFVQAQDSRVF